VRLIRNVLLLWRGGNVATFSFLLHDKQWRKSHIPGPVCRDLHNVGRRRRMLLGIEIRFLE